MFKNSDSDNNIEVGHRHSGRTFREVPLVNLFEKTHGPLAQDEGFYSGEEEELLNEEHSESAREEEGKTEEPRSRRIRNFRDYAYHRSKYYYSSCCSSNT
jgi:hypothetical protein